jgi:hypothetical protein
MQDEDHLFNALKKAKVSEEEKAFTQAAEEYYGSASHLRSHRFINKR